MFDRFIKPILIVIAMSILVWIIFAAFINFFKKKYRRKISRKAKLIFLLFYMYTVFVISLTIIPLPFNKLKPSSAGINVIPLVDMVTNLRRAFIWPEYPFAKRTLENVIGNIVLFIPLGIFLPFFSYTYRSLANVVVLAFICSVSIELIQLIERLFEIYRFVDIDDVILNTTGAILGFVVIHNLVLKHDKLPGRNLMNW
jgi:glycopeptide antibiotics resistance protein